MRFQVNDGQSDEENSGEYKWGDLNHWECECDAVTRYRLSAIGDGLKLEARNPQVGKARGTHIAIVWKN